MPTVTKELVGRGIRFTQAFVVNPLCCPSRASILTGKYSHSTGVWRNAFPNGGFKSFDDSQTIATTLQAAGYRTALMGKYLNGYGEEASLTGYVPPGWDRWVAFVRSNYYGYQLNIDGTVKDFGDRPPDYSTNVLRREARRFLRRTEGRLFLYFAPYAPHGPATPAGRHAGKFSDLPPLRPPSYNEADVSDKPRFIRRIRQLAPEERARLDNFRLDQLRSLLAVDDAIANILEVLDEGGRLPDSLIVFTADNGLALGEHRWREKQTAYEESVHVPLIVRWDRRFAGPGEVDRFALNIDIVPTIVEAVGMGQPRANGKSVVPLLEDASTPWRGSFLIEHLTDPLRPFVPSYCAIRTRRYLYAVYSTGERELYDLKKDPDELESRMTDPPASDLRKRLRALCSPKPPGFDVAI